ncbi:MAG: divalent metal cation transporter [Betaproteobacteria bacterium]|nr:divalent metal cation transporter [Betaproteobacteria bacterium]
MSAEALARQPIAGAAAPRGSLGWAALGPALLVTVGYMDPGNWATDIAGGAGHGYLLLSVVLMSSLMAMPLQILAARLGAGSGRDLATCCREYYPRQLSLALWLLAELGIIACDLAELIGVALALYLLFGLPLEIGILLGGADAILILYLQDRGLCRLEAVVLGLIAVVAACLAIVICMAPPGPGELLRGLVPDQRIFTQPELLFLAIGIIGATVMPHNIYLQSWLARGQPGADKPAAIRASSNCTVFAMTLAFFINAAILAVAASVFHRAGRADVVDIRDAYELLSPLVGIAGASTLFALALLAAGISSTLTATLAGQVVMEGFLRLRIPGWQRRLFTRLLAMGPALYAVGHGGDSAIGPLLILSQVVLSLQLPFALVPLLHFTGSKRVMGANAAPSWLASLGWVICAVLVALDIKLVSHALASL